jgi:muramoyltetrapeptide carboxypeptidase LdcA involved in peptidoglycan recycling
LTHDDTFWSTFEDGGICAVPLSALRERDQPWRCSRIAGSLPAPRLVETQQGAIWASTPNGAFRWDGEQWRSIAASLRLPTQFAALAPGRDGTIWVMGADLLRVADRPDLKDGWLVLEQFAALPGVQWANDLIELPDGGLAISSVRGLVYLPASARHSVSRVPPVVLTDVRRDGLSLPPSARVGLPHRAGLLELQVAAPIYVDRGPLRYRARAHADQMWSVGKGPTFSFIDLPFGRYRAEIQASLDGEHWSQPPLAFSFSVARPWYLRWWAIAAAVLAPVSLLTFAYKLRVSMFRRLERQRARIARDLHDELGSGLGSIGILAGVMAEGETLDSTQLRGTAATILQTAEELGTALADIAWALRPGEAAGVLLGGTLTQLLASQATPFAFAPPAGHVLFIDEVGERPYRLDRMVTQLRQTGLLARAAAVVIGELPQCDEPGGGLTARAVMADLFADFPGPVLIGFPSGHTSGPAFTLPLGVSCRVIAGARPRLIIDEAAVE